MRLFRGSNAAGRRKYQREMQRQWVSVAPMFAEGTSARIVTERHGVSYNNTKVVVLGKGDTFNTYVVRSNKRKTPLVVLQDDLQAA